MVCSTQAPCPSPSPSHIQVFVTPWPAAPRPPVSHHLPVVSKSLWPHGLQHPGPLSLTISQSLPQFTSIASVMPSSRLILWCLLLLLPSTYSNSRVFSSESAVCIQWVGCLHENIGASVSAWVLPKSVQGWSPLRLTGLISLKFKGLSGVFSHTTVRRHQFFGFLPSFYTIKIF